jgi:hypothetical protein
MHQCLGLHKKTCYAIFMSVPTNLSLVPVTVDRRDVSYPVRIREEFPCKLGPMDVLEKRAIADISISAGSWQRLYLLCRLLYTFMCGSTTMVPVLLSRSPLRD